VMAKVETFECDNSGCGKLTKQPSGWIRLTCRPHTGRGIAAGDRVVIRLPGENTDHAVSPPGGFAFCGYSCLIGFMEKLCHRKGDKIIVPKMGSSAPAAATANGAKRKGLA